MLNAVYVRAVYDCVQEDLKAFLHGLMVRTGANAAPGNAILSCKLKSVSSDGGGVSSGVVTGSGGGAETCQAAVPKQQAPLRAPTAVHGGSRRPRAPLFLRPPRPPQLQQQLAAPACPGLVDAGNGPAAVDCEQEHGAAVAAQRKRKRLSATAALDDEEALVLTDAAPTLLGAQQAPGAGGGMPPPGLPPGPPDKHYAFIELRSVEEASNAMAFDGVAFRNAYLKVGSGARHAFGRARCMVLCWSLPNCRSWFYPGNVVLYWQVVLLRHVMRHNSPFIRTPCVLLAFPHGAYVPGLSTWCLLSCLQHLPPTLRHPLLFIPSRLACTSTRCTGAAAQQLRRGHRHDAWPHQPRPHHRPVPARDLPHSGGELAAQAVRGRPAVRVERGHGERRRGYGMAQGMCSSGSILI